MSSTTPSNKEYEALLRLCTEVCAIPDFSVFALRHPKAEALRTYLKKRIRYEWVEVGTVLYLYTVKAKRDEQPRAMIRKEKARSFFWQLLGGSRFSGKAHEGTATSLSEAKKRVAEVFHVTE